VAPGNQFRGRFRRQARLASSISRTTSSGRCHTWSSVTSTTSNPASRNAVERAPSACLSLSAVWCRSLWTSTMSGSRTSRKSTRPTQASPPESTWRRISGSPARAMTAAKRLSRLLAGGHIVVATLVEEGAQHLEAGTPVDTRVGDEPTERAAGQQAPPPHVVDSSRGAERMLAGAQLERKALRSNDRNRLQHGDVSGQQQLDLVKHRQSRPPARHPAGPRDVHRGTTDGRGSPRGSRPCGRTRKHPATHRGLRPARAGEPSAGCPGNGARARSPVRRHPGGPRDGAPRGSGRPYVPRRRGPVRADVRRSRGRSRARARRT
jgi:hypothetical protein